MKRIAAVFALLAVLFWLPGCTSYASTIEKNWGLRLPDGYREVYSAESATTSSNTRRARLCRTPPGARPAGPRSTPAA